MAKPLLSAGQFRAKQRVRLDSARFCPSSRNPIKDKGRAGIQERIASIACAIKMPTLKTIKKMSNQVFTSTSCLGSEPPCLCTVKGIAQRTVISAAAEDSLPHGGLSSEREEKERADDGGREKWKPNVRHFMDSDSLRRIKCELRSQFF
ncbi:hypothetical protein JQ596_30310 [Bradyrhizobium manausense]|uniref:hypothetical protein n=1 Tax=Bradyrhizobium manausense TaxID=989370 RepID=UPI001BA9146C|nr:hypothetical protein [Bradyrhizobium manausense]MBR0829831.1 hypothetical protein [Bradyrhizobium manausense]